MSIDPTEARLQQEMYVWYNNAYCLPHHNPRCIIWHTPNEGQQRLISIGLLPGVSDLTLVHSIAGIPHSVHIYCEVKRPTKKQSPAQLEFMQRVRALGHYYYVAHSLPEFVAGLRAIEQTLLQTLI
jgi:hypothetical protein